jgi:2-methylisocitrate lyase-like PEP mutase family enzyme
MKREQREKGDAFRALHVPGDPLILFNAWDAGSAKAIAAAGAKAIATGSWSVAAAHGYRDGEQLPLDLALANLERIVAAVELPVSIDLERGYGEAPDDVAVTVERAVAAGAVGCNIEDRSSGAELFGIDEQAARLAAARRAGGDMFLNARVDLFLTTPPEEHDEALVDRALERAFAYAEAGSDGIFPIALSDEALIERFCASCPKPVNLFASPAAPPAARLAALGAARISHGPGPYRRVMAFLEEAARAALAR